jgi:hypothetical protein
LQLSFLDEQSDNFCQKQGVAFCLGMYRLHQRPGRGAISRYLKKAFDLFLVQSGEEQALQWLLAGQFR